MRVIGLTKRLAICLINTYLIEASTI